MTLYLEQYLDNLQTLPGELQRKLRLLRDLDQKAQHHMNEGDRLTSSYVECASTLNSTDRKKRYEEIQSHYSKAKTLGDEKVQLAMQTYEMVDKHIRRLDADLARFESELKRNVLLSKQEEANVGKVGVVGNNTLVAPNDGGGEKKYKKSAADNEKEKKKRGKEEDAALQKSAKKKRKVEDSASGGKPDVNVGGGGVVQQEIHNLTSLTGVGLMQQLAGIGADVLDMPIDPNEPVYCVCRQVSYGEMIGCDNLDCPIEWFHFNCVGLTSKPKGKWFCPRCTEEKKKQKS